MAHSLSRRRMLQSAAAAGTMLAAGAVRVPGHQGNTAAADGARGRLEALIGGYRLTQMVAIAAKLEIADYLKQGSRTVRDLARLTGSHEDSLYRLLRTLAGYEVFAEEAGPAFRLTPMADLLRKDATGSMRIAAEIPADTWAWRSWGSAMHSIKTGEVAFNHVFGKSQWEWFAENPREAELFNAFMTEITNLETGAILAAYDFKGARTVVDVAGGQGALLVAILGRHPAARGTLFELPQVIASARKVIDHSVASRIEFTDGDFFKSVPSGGDIYILKNIIHDWNDAQSRDILGVCRKAMNGRGRLLIIEHVVCEPNRRCPGKMSDMIMLIAQGGRNRTEKEYAQLLDAGGFKLTRIIPTRGPAIVEALAR